MNYTYIIFAILTMAGVTYFVRAIPFALAKNKIENQFVRSFLEYIPYAVLSAMTFPSILFATSNIYACFGGLVVAIALAYFEKSLVTVAIGASISAFLINLINF